MPLDAFDPEPRAVIDPEDTVTRPAGCPRIAVSCFSHVTMGRLTQALDAEQIACIHVANLSIPPTFRSFIDHLNGASSLGRGPVCARRLRISPRSGRMRSIRGSRAKPWWVQGETLVGPGQSPGYIMGAKMRSTG